MKRPKPARKPPQLRIQEQDWSALGAAVLDAAREDLVKHMVEEARRQSAWPIEAESRPVEVRP